MRCYKFALGISILIFGGQGVFAMPQRMSYSETKKTIQRIKDRSEKFKDNFKHDVDKSGIASDTRHDMKQTVDQFEESTEHLDKKYSKDNAAVPAVREVLSEGAMIDSYLAQHVVSPRVQDEWLLLRRDLDHLARSYNLVAEWPSSLARAEMEPPVAHLAVAGTKCRGFQGSGT
jgi:hypothetical protein